MIAVSSPPSATASTTLRTVPAGVLTGSVTPTILRLALPTIVVLVI